MNSALIDKIKRLGFRVWMRHPEDNFLLFTDKDGKKIGYLQDSGPEAISLSTVHKPNRTTGTGFGLFRYVDERDLSHEDLDACFCLYPMWVSHSDRDSVKKWKGIDEYRAANKFNAAYLER